MPSSRLTQLVGHGAQLVVHQRIAPTARHGQVRVLLRQHQLPSAQAQGGHGQRGHVAGWPQLHGGTVGSKRRVGLVLAAGREDICTVKRLRQG